MSNNEALKRIEAARAELAAAEEALKEAEKPKSGLLWKPNHGDEYWSITSDGSIFNSTWTGAAVDLHRLELGNVYLTEHTAKKAMLRNASEVKVTRRLAELCAEEGWVADWNSREQYKYRPLFNHLSRNLDSSDNSYCQLAPLHWYGSRTAWNTVISEMEPDVRLMLGV